MSEVHYYLYLIINISIFDSFMRFQKHQFYCYLIIWIITGLIHCLKMCFDYLSLMQPHFVLAAFDTAQLIVF